MPINPLPPAPDVGDRANFAAEATTWAAALPGWTSEVNAMAAAFGPGAPFCEVSGTANAVALTSGYDIAALADGQSVAWEPTVANTGAVTINLDGLGARSAVTIFGAALPSGYITPGQVTAAVYDASTTRWVVMPPITTNSGLSAAEDHKIPVVAAVRNFVNNLVMGVGQTWQDVSGSRVANTSYQNTTGRTIFVAIVTPPEVGRPIQVSANNSTWVQVGFSSGSSGTSSGFPVPAGWYYRVNGAGAISAWSELR